MGCEKPKNHKERDQINGRVIIADFFCPVKCEPRVAPCHFINGRTHPEHIFAPPHPRWDGIVLFRGLYVPAKGPAVVDGQWSRDSVQPDALLAAMDDRQWW